MVGDQKPLCLYEGISRVEMRILYDDELQGGLAKCAQLCPGSGWYDIYL